MSPSDYASYVDGFSRRIFFAGVGAAAQTSAATASNSETAATVAASTTASAQPKGERGSLQRQAIGKGPVPLPVHVLNLHEQGASITTPAFVIGDPFPLYFGGPIISNVHVVQVLYGAGSYVPGVQATTTPSVASFFADITQSSYFDMLAEYNTAGVGGADGTAGTSQTVGHGFFDGQFTITPSTANNGNTITDSQIQAELLAQVNAGKLPAPVLDAQGNVNTLYMVYFPAGKTIQMGTALSCQKGGFCAYHNSTNSLFGGKNLLYGVLPDVQPPGLCSTGCGTGGLLDIVTNVTSHELSEAVTDANVGQATVFARPLAWFDPINGEIGDICVGVEAPVVANGTTYTVQMDYSNVQQDCAAGPVAFQMTAGPDVGSGTQFDIGMATSSNPNHNLLSNYQGTVHFTSSDPAAVLPADYTFTFADEGQHHFLATLNTGGQQTITATDAAIQGGGTTIKLGVNVPNVSQFTLAVPGTATTGTSVTVIVSALDSSAVLQTNYNGKVHFTSSDAGAILPPDTSLVNGTGTFSVTFNNAGDQNLQVADALKPTIARSNLVSVSAPSTNATTTTLTADRTTAPFGQSIQLTVKVTAAAPITQAGSVSITVDGLPFVAGGILDTTLALLNSNGGEHTIYANYFGNGVQAPSSSAPLTVTFTPVASIIVLTSESPSAQFGTPVTLQAQITPNATINSRGSVTFFDGSVPLAILPASDTFAPGFVVSTLPVGSHSLTASFSGSPDLLPSNSAAIPQVITPSAPADYAISGSNSALTVHAGQSAAFKIDASSRNGFTGTVSFSCGPLPPLTTCTFIPAQIPVGGRLSSAQTTLVLKTSGPNALLSPSPLRPQQHMNAMVWSGGLFAVGIVLIVSRRRRALIAGMTLLLLTTVISCGGGGTQQPPPPTPTPTPVASTPTGQSTVTVFAVGTATAGASPATPKQQLQVTINVQP